MNSETPFNVWIFGHGMTFNPSILPGWISFTARRSGGFVLAERRRVANRRIPCSAGSIWPHATILAASFIRLAHARRAPRVLYFDYWVERRPGLAASVC